MSTKQPAMPTLSGKGQAALDQYEAYLGHELDLQPVTVRNYVGDVRLFMAWCERGWTWEEAENSFSPDRVATPTITRYRDYLQHELGRKPATINRYLVSLKRYFAWAIEHDLIRRNPAQVVKLTAQESSPPHHLTDQEEEALIAAVETSGNLRDYTLIILLLHTGLRIGEACNLKQEHITLRARSGRLQIWGKRNKYREVPLNVTARSTLAAYQTTLPSKTGYLFLSQRTCDKLTP
jgi:integrase/recombinase XerD